MEEIHVAAANGDIAALVRMINLGGDKDARDESGATPLHWAAARAQLEAVRLLVGLGVKINTANEVGYTPLMVAARHGFTAVAELLLEHGADVNAHTNDGTTALMFAAGYASNPDVLGTLAGAGASLEDRREDGATALMWAAGAGRLQNVRALIELGANAQVVDDSGRTAADRAIERSRPEVVEFLESAVRFASER